MALNLRTPSARNPATMWLVVLALLVAQSLGLWHRVAHQGSSADATAVTAVRALDVASLEAAQPTWLERLFSNHHDGGDCLGFDHAAQGAALLGAVLALVRVAAQILADALPSLPSCGARWRHFSARAPPVFR